MNYTHNWNQEFISSVKHINLSNQKLCLEIGCFEGLTSNYISDNILSDDGKLICVDPLEDNYLVTDLTDFDINNNKNGWSYFSGQYGRFMSNTSKNTENKIELIRKISSEAYPELRKKYEGQFDFIYIDGDHRELAVYEDAVNCFDLCKTNGYILFDDYLWKDFSDEQVTKKGVDKFVSEYSEKIEIILDGNQFLIKKK